MQDLGPTLRVIKGSDPGLLRKVCRDGAADPDRVGALGRSNDADPDSLGNQLGQVLRQPVCESREHGGPARENDVFVQLSPQINLCLLDGLVDELGEPKRSCLFKPNHRRVEQDLGDRERLWPKVDRHPVAHLVRLRLHRPKLCLVVERNTAGLLLQILHGLHGRRIVLKLVPLVGKQREQPPCEIPPSHVQTVDRTRNRVPLHNRNNMRHSLPTVQNNPRRPPRRIQRKHCLQRNVQRRNPKRLKHNLGHLLPVLQRVQRRLGQKHRLVLRINIQSLKENMLPDLLNIIPVLHNPMLHRVPQIQPPTQRLCRVPNVELLKVLLPFLRRSYTVHKHTPSQSPRLPKKSPSPSFISTERTSLQIVWPNPQHNIKAQKVVGWGFRKRKRGGGREGAEGGGGGDGERERQWKRGDEGGDEGKRIG